MATFAPQSRLIRREWLASPEGLFALGRTEELLGKLLSGWPRRARSMLVMNAGSGLLLETLWQAGFDVTGQEDDPEFLTAAKASTSRNMDFFQSAPDHLPYNDCAFDYAVAAGAVEFWENPEAVLKELSRVICQGLIIIFPNSYSLCGVTSRFGKPHPLFQYPDNRLLSPRHIWRLTRKVFGKRATGWASVLHGPCRSWKPHCRFTRLNSTLVPFPFGAVAGLRIDFGPICTGTPLLLRTAEPVVSAK